MKIVNICMSAPFTEGYTYQDSMLSDYQQRLGHDVTVITGLKTRDKNGKVILTEPGESVLDNGVTLIRLAPQGGGKIAHNILGIYPNISRILKELSPELIMVHGLGSHVPQYAVKYKKSHPHVCLVADTHQDYGITNTNNILLKIVAHYFRVRWKSWIHAFEKIYAVTSWRTLFAHEQYGIPYNKMDILILGIDDMYINLCENQDNRRNIREKYGIAQDAFLFVSGGKLDSNKKIIPMMRAFSRLQQENMCYLIFGSVSDDIAEEFQEILQSDCRIVHIGYIPSFETNYVMAASDFGLFAGNHSVLWEQAVGCGLPCLFKKYGDKDHTDVGGNCVSICTPEESQIYHFMEEVVSNPEQYRKMKDAARAGAPLFSYSSIAKKSIECVDGINERVSKHNCSDL